MKKAFFLFTILLSVIQLSSKAKGISYLADTALAKVNGKIIDSKGEPLPYAYVLVEGTSNGTTSNSKGEYSLKLPKGNYVLTFQYLGFKKIKRSVALNADQRLDVQMEVEEVQLKTFTVTNKYKDPAYGIIKEAQRKRKDNLEAVQSYSSDVYIKGIGKLDRIPKDRPAMLFFIPKDQMPDSSDLGLVYLSESKAKLYVQKPDNVKEEMISSKVAGNSQGYSWNRIGDTELKANFYHNLLKMEGLTQRGFVSPISQNALLFYDYKLEGEIKEGNRIINKIKVIPKRKSDPVFSGYIYIIEGTWNITGIDFALGANQIEYFEEFKVRQDYVSINDSIWMPGTVTYSAKIGAMGFKASFTNVVNYTNYEVNREFPQFFFKNEIFKIEKEANKKDSTYWTDIRPVLLTGDEIKYYQKADSLEKAHNTKEYLDSVDLRQNKVTIPKLLLGYNFYRRYNETVYSTNPITDIVNFNTVEGLNANFVFSFRKGKWSNKHFVWSTTLRYGFINGHFNPKTELYWNFNKFRQQTIGIEGGKDVDQVNYLDPITPLLNTFYSLVLRENYMKIYERTFGRIHYSHEFFNGVYFKGSVTYSNRHALTNRSNYSFAEEKEGRVYTSNNPQNTSNDEIAFEDHQALVFNGELKFIIKQQYLTLPEQKVPSTSKYPIFTLRYSKGANFAGSDINFDRASFSVNDNLSFGLLGKSSWAVTVGGFLNKNKTYFLDYNHFSGNQTIFLNVSQPTGNFQLLDYYTMSTLSSYIEAHYEHHFNGFIINKIPILRKSKFQEVAGVNFLRTQDNNEHVEVQFGIENIAKFFRIDFVTGYNNLEKVKGAVRIRFGLDLF